VARVKRERTGIRVGFGGESVTEFLLGSRTGMAKKKKK
jgi:hypothetical protein